MAKPFSNILKNLDKSFTAFAKSKAAMPVILGATAVVAVAAVAVYATSSVPSNGSSLDQSSSQMDPLVSSGNTLDDNEDDLYVDATIDTDLYTDTVLHESEDAGEAYIDSTLFLGDSNTYRYMNYGFADLTNAVGVVGMGVGGIESLECVKFKTYKDYVTIPDALPIMQPQRVVFAFGTNNLGGGVSGFIETYAEGIQACYDAYPYFDIIITAVPPVDKNTVYTNVTMNQINKFNAALVEMCEENGWKFLNTSEVLIDPDTGYAYRDYTISDGLHLSLDGCTTLFDYIRTHAYETEDKRPMPLKKVLERDETPPDLITEDPLKSDKPLGGGTTQVTTAAVYFAASEGGYLMGEVDQSIVPGSSSSAVTAMAEEGYYFAGWGCSYAGLSSASDASVTYTVPTDVNAFGGVVVTAYFAKDSYDVMFTLAGDTSGAKLSTSSASVPYGGSVSTTLTLKDDYTATASKGSISGSTVTVSDITKDTNVTITINAPVATPTPIVTPTATPTATPAPTATATPAPTATATPAPTATATPAPTATATPEPTPVATPTPEPTPVATPTPAPTPEPTPVATPTPEPTPEPTPVETQTPPADPTEAPTEAPEEGENTNEGET